MLRLSKHWSENIYFFWQNVCETEGEIIFCIEIATKWTYKTLLIFSFCEAFNSSTSTKVISNFFSICEITKFENTNSFLSCTGILMDLKQKQFYLISIFGNIQARLHSSRCQSQQFFTSGKVASWTICELPSLQKIQTGRVSRNCYWYWVFAITTLFSPQLQFGWQPLRFTS